MKKSILLLLSTILLSVSSLDAALYKGQKIFLKKCVSCHTSKLSFIRTKTIDEWEDFMEDKGKPLAEVHLEDENAKKSWKYFKSKKFYKKSKHLKQFLVEYAKDSGNVPACN